MNRIDRISAILIQLQSRRITTAQHIADRFKISLRTVYRDVRSLEQAGIPIIGEAGVGYSIMEGYRLPPVMFTREEAIAFLTAEKLVEQFTDADNGTHYRSALYKIKAVLRTTEKDLLENIDNRIEVLKSRRIENTQPDLKLLQPILKGISDKKVLALQYFSHYKQEDTDRYVEPVGVIFLDNYWHLIAYCRLRNDYRDFRLDRIGDILTTSETFCQQHISLKEYLKNSYQERPLEEVIIRVDKHIANYLNGEKYYHGFISQTEIDENTFEMNFLTMSLGGFSHWYMMFALHGSIIKPESLREAVKVMASKISLKLSAS